ncbi:MAG: hypothetical protein M3O22_02380 [Pseudomonadota bacterium]|nr:hypothetical protein [Pseudomonadota bacterium]
MIDPGSVDRSVCRIFDTYAEEGFLALQKREGRPLETIPSHVCLKFRSRDSWLDHIRLASGSGPVSLTPFKGLEIAWIRLGNPLRKESLVIH